MCDIIHKILKVFNSSLLLCTIYSASYEYFIQSFVTRDPFLDIASQLENYIPFPSITFTDLVVL